MDEKSNLYIVAIVGVIAVVALVVLVIGVGANKRVMPSAGVSSVDATGQVYLMRITPEMNKRLYNSCTAQCPESEIMDDIGWHCLMRCINQFDALDNLISANGGYMPLP
jgi:hypothetical protein